jgi:tetratricopeptide (TPR) repeat protein
MVGDLLVASGKFDTAQTYYGRLAKAPWPDYQMRAGIALGKAQLAEKKTDEALQSFETVLKTSAKGPQADRQRLAATLGKSRCLAMVKKSDEAVRLAESVIAQADPEESNLLAEAYNALGVAYREAGRPKDALLAFLHVDVLYFTSRADHIEALENLITLWNEVQKPERAADAVQILKERYNKEL